MLGGILNKSNLIDLGRGSNTSIFGRLPRGSETSSLVWESNRSTNFQFKAQQVKMLYLISLLRIFAQFAQNGEFEISQSYSI